MTEAIQTLDELQPLPTKIYGFLQEAVPIAIQHFEEWSRKKQNGDPTLDPHLFPHLVRYHVCRLLTEADYEASLIEGHDDSLPPSIRTMAMSGIEIVFRGRKLKLWKSRKGGIPLPGRSESRRAFLQENRVLFGSTGEFFKATNLVLLWDVDSTGDVTLDLVCPMPSDFDQDDVEDWKFPQLWSVSVPDAATLVQPSTGIFGSTDSAGYEDDFSVIEPETEAKEEDE